MSDKNGMIKRILLVVVAIVVIVLLAIGGMWFFVIGWWSKDSSAGAPSTDPKDASYYDFENNTGIKDRKAAGALKKLRELTQEEKDKMTKAVYDELMKNQASVDVKFTGIEKVAFVRVIGDMMTNNKDVVDYFSRLTVSDDENKEPTVKNLMVELACQIKMRKKGANICLLQYNEYLYTVKDYAKEKSDIDKIPELVERAKRELYALGTQLTEAINGADRDDRAIINNWLLERKIDEIIKPDEKA